MMLVRSLLLSWVLLQVAVWCDTPVIFLGLSGAGAPGIEKKLTRLMKEQFAVTSGITLVHNDESERLAARIDDFSYPAMTAPLAAALRRFAPDSALIVWGSVRECSIKPKRRYFFTAYLEATLIIELTVFNRGTRSYAYIGDAKARLTRDKGALFWFGRVEDAITVSATERSELIDMLLVEGAKASSSVLLTILSHSRSKHRGKTPPPGVKTKEIPASGEHGDSIKEPVTPEKTDVVPQEEEAGEAPLPE